MPTLSDWKKAKDLAKKAGIDTKAFDDGFLSKTSTLSNNASDFKELGKEIAKKQDLCDKLRKERNVIIDRYRAIIQTFNVEGDKAKQTAATDLMEYLKNLGGRHSTEWQKLKSAAKKAGLDVGRFDDGFLAKGSEHAKSSLELTKLKTKESDLCQTLNKHGSDLEKTVIKYKSIVGSWKIDGNREKEAAVKALKAFLDFAGTQAGNAQLLRVS